ncbi:MAG TPA: molybdenum cofactor guanylyltransferase [Terriglobales bacterium]
MYHRNMDPVNGFVLAGGKSTRMGRDKTLLELAGHPLIEHMTELVRTICDQACIVGERAKFSRFAPVVEDVYPGHGPLGGIHAALASSETDLNLVIGVDLPFLPEGFLRYLISQSRSSGAVITIPEAGGHLQTLCAVYRKEFAEVAQRALSSGRNKVDAAFAEVSIKKISGDELVKAGFDAAIFRNVNTPEDWHEAQREFASRVPGAGGQHVGEQR